MSGGSPKSGALMIRLFTQEARRLDQCSLDRHGLKHGRADGK
jgi:hypothetical protein